MDENNCPAILPQAGPASQNRGLHHARELRSSSTKSEAFRIEYWALEEAKIRRQPAEKELSRGIVLDRRRSQWHRSRELSFSPQSVARIIVVADLSQEAAQKVADECESHRWQRVCHRRQPSTSASVTPSKTHLTLPSKRPFGGIDHTHQYRRHVSILTRRRHNRRAVGAHARESMSQQTICSLTKLPPSLRQQGTSRQRRSHQLRERSRSQEAAPRPTTFQ